MVAGNLHLPSFTTEFLSHFNAQIYSFTTFSVKRWQETLLETVFETEYTRGFILFLLLII